MSDYSINGTFYRSLAKDEKIRIGFLLQDATLWPSWEKLYETCERDERLDVRLFHVPRTEFTYEPAIPAVDFLAATGIPYTAFSYCVFESFKPHIAFLQTPYDYLGREPYLYSKRLKSLGIRVAYVPYGIEIVDTPFARFDHFRTPVIKNAWRIYTISDAVYGEYRKYCSNSDSVRPLGLPRFDALLQRERFVLQPFLEERVGARRLVIWHAHFAKVSWLDGRTRQITPYLEEYIDFAAMLEQYQEDFFFIFLPHPKFGTDAADEVSNRKSAEVIRRIKAAENAFVDRAVDYRPSLLNADAIITDRSSLMIEAAIADVPVLLLENPENREKILPPLQELTDSYDHGTGCTDMVSFMEQLKVGVDDKRRQRAEALEKCIPCLDGHCSERIKEELCSSMLAETVELKLIEYTPIRTVKIVLFGTGFLFSTIMDFFEFPAHCEIIALCDNDNAKWGKRFGGLSVVSPEDLRELDFDKVIITATNIFEEQVYRQLRFDLEIPESKIEFCDYLSLLKEI